MRTQEWILWVPKFEERTQDETLKQERCVCREAWDLAMDVYKLKKGVTRYVLLDVRTLFDKSRRATIRDRLLELPCIC